MDTSHIERRDLRRVLLLVLVTLAASGAAAVSGVMGWTLQFGAVGLVYAAAGWWAAGAFERPWPLLLLTAPWAGGVGAIAIPAGLAHVYPLLVVSVVGAVAGYGIRRRSETSSRSLGAAALFAVALAAGTWIGMPNWLAATLGRPDRPPDEIAAASRAFSFAEPARGLAGASAPQAFAGRVTVLDLWTTTCAACFKRFPELETLSERYAGDPRVEVYAVNLTVPTDTEGQAEAMLDAFDYDFRSLYADLSFDDAQETYGIRGVPAIVIYGPDGEVTFVGRPESNPVVLIHNVRREIEAALGDV